MDTLFEMPPREYLTQEAKCRHCVNVMTDGIYMYCMLHDWAVEADGSGDMRYVNGGDVVDCLGFKPKDETTRIEV